MSNLKGKKLLILGGIAHSCVIVEKAKEMGITVYVTDYLENSPAKRIADKSFMVSTTDIEAIEELCKDESIDGIITGFIDSMLPFCYKACERMKLPFWGTKEQIDISINKDKFKKACKKNGVPIIQEYYLTKEFTKNDLDKIEYPVLVKPVDNSGSRGVFICDNEVELKENYKKALAFSKSKNIIVEQYIKGHHVNMYYTLCDGEVYLSAMADRYVTYLDNTAPLPKGLYHPSRYLKEYIETVNSCIKKMFLDLGMRDGLVFVQGFHTDKGFKIYEMGYRLNGGATYELIDACNGYNQLESIIEFSITGNMGNVEALKKTTPFFKTIAFNLVLSLLPGTITKVIGVDEVKNLPGVINFIMLHSEGDCLVSHGTSAQIFAYVLINVDDTEHLEKILNKIKEKVKVLDEHGDNMLLDIFEAKELK
ncbi:ATP-grasp domain-containing protein [Herbivorax sp. ANBcel31]|uniref:ATP-grasp domain-containing protein n=1 Tax=Herbivorax sp. ANBcel31 TaxID=3069754 RepID=UPI0027AF2896|nr:ATP-grasp domain-containing protein [Herbivorax sp. ANBcel31]MDQ2085655.1 ATP-grasp domain-containing protein [Herbivorax sp. ANBcel31]